MFYLIWFASCYHIRRWFMSFAITFPSPFLPNKVGDNYQGTVINCKVGEGRGFLHLIYWFGNPKMHKSHLRIFYLGCFYICFFLLLLQSVFLKESSSSLREFFLQLIHNNILKIKDRYMFILNFIRTFHLATCFWLGFNWGRSLKRTQLGKGSKPFHFFPQWPTRWPLRATDWASEYLPTHIL